jgi:hypothetical protein
MVELTLQSRHLLPYGFILPFPPFTDCPGFEYGVALALAVRSLFSPIFRVDEDGLKGSGAARVDVF